MKESEIQVITMVHQAETPNDHKDTEAANLHLKEDPTDEDEGSLEASSIQL